VFGSRLPSPISGPIKKWISIFEKRNRWSGVFYEIVVCAAGAASVVVSINPGAWLVYAGGISVLTIEIMRIAVISQEAEHRV